VNVSAGRAVYKSAECPETSGWGGATLLREIIALDVNARGRRGRDLTRRMLYLPALIVAGVLLACAATVLALSEKAVATFPGKNGRIAYSAFDFDTGVDDRIYTIKAGGGHKTQLTRGYQPSYSPNGKKIAYTVFSGADSEIYTINVGGDAKTQLTHNDTDEFTPDYSPDGKTIVYAGL
jgi:WD40-like Beta Propeller Repeat